MEDEEDDFIAEDDRPDLPPNAGQMTQNGFEPDDNWLRSADWKLQHEAMRQWFLSRFQNPAEDTPYITAEGGYQYLHSGPYSAEDELYGRFGNAIQDPDKFIRRVIDDVESDGILEWARVHRDAPDYDLAFEFEANTREDPARFLNARLTEVDALSTAMTDERLRPLLRQSLFTSLIAALEAYLADTMSFWVAVDKPTFRLFVRECEEFQKQKLPVSEIFDRMEKLEDGMAVTVGDESLGQLRRCLSSFVDQIEAQLAKKILTGPF